MKRFLEQSQAIIGGEQALVKHGRPTLVLVKRDIAPGRGRPPDERANAPVTVEPLDPEVLAARPEVKRAKRRTQRLSRPAYVNTDASWRKGLAGLAYDSWALGQRIEVVACEDIVKAEHLALLMAMEDAVRALSGSIAFRVDSTAVANMAIGKKPHLNEVRERIKTLLKRHADWSVVLVERKRNKVANNLACRPFLEMGQNADSSATVSQRGARGPRGAGSEAHRATSRAIFASMRGRWEPPWR